MDSHLRKVTVNQYSDKALPFILKDAVKARQFGYDDVADCLMVAAFNKIMPTTDRLDGVDSDDADFAKAMLKITAISLLTILEDFDASKIIEELSEYEDEEH